MGRGSGQATAISFATVLGPGRHGSSVPAPPPSAVVGLELTATGKVIVYGAEVELSLFERRLFIALFSDPDRCFAFDELVRAIFPHPQTQSPARRRRLESVAAQLRNKLRHSAPDNRWVHRIQGVGYRLR